MWKVGFLSPADQSDHDTVFGELPFEVDTPVTRDAAGVADVVGTCDILVSDWSGKLVPTGADLASAPYLCFVQKPGSGVDDYDVAALTRAGIPIANTSGVTAPSMAEWCLGAAINLVRRMGDADTWVRSGEWPQLKLADRGAVELASLRVGVVGFGPVGRMTAERFRGIGCAVAYWSRRQRDPTESGGIPWLPLDDLLSQSDVLVVAIALTDDTRNLIDRRRVELLPPGAFVVNVARGAIVDERAIIDGLVDGRITGAALDVFATEPLPADSPLRTLDRVILSPHSSANTSQSRARLLTAVNENLARIAAGEPVKWVVNGMSPSITRKR
jgi:phosphoglycerate dehydrogenase-like enzyme